MNYAPTAPSETPDLAFLDPDTRIERAEAALAEERSISSAILDTVPALVVVLDPEFKIVRFNKSCEVSTGYVFKELKEKEIWPLFFAPEHAEPFRLVFERLRNRAESTQFEWNFGVLYPRTFAEAQRGADR
jgi:PAS domain-containing protein